MLVVHRADRADDLADALGELLAEPLPDPFAAEVVAVHTRGMERWLTQRLSGVLGSGGEARRDGVCANVRFPFPARLIAEAVAAAAGVDPERDPWRPERSAWALLEVVQECLGQPWLATLASYLGAAGAPDPVRRARRLTTVAHLAGLFDAYALHRPRMIAAWAAGSDHDELGRELSDEARWQAELWRRLRARIGIPGPAERREQACERLASRPDPAQLPQRISLFGLTRLPAGHLAVLEALAQRRDVHLLLLHPSPALWAAIAGRADRPSARPLARERDATAPSAGHPLLASWGRDATEMQLVLGDHAGVEPRDRDHGRGHPQPATLLACIQADIRADRAPPGPPADGTPERRPPLAGDDRSLQLHACHGRQRQVEVLRDAILHALADDPTLEPRDVIVMCPDIETFAPLIQATFGAGDADPDGEGARPHSGTGDARDRGDVPMDVTRVDLRVRLADRALAQTNPILGVVATLLELTGRRLTASQVLDLADRAPVRRRFGLDDDALARTQDWIAQSGIRWGLDAEHRAPYKLARLPDGTWRAGLDRLLLGVAMSEERRRLFAGVLPLDDVDSASIDLAGRLTELVARLGLALDSFATPQPLSGWARSIAAAADSLAEAPAHERWQRADLHRVLEELVWEAGGRADGDAATLLSAAEIGRHLGERLGGRPTRANFRTGHLTVCTLMPMRSVPHRVVCLLGLDDGAFPRRALRDGDDLLLSEPLVGERDPRSEDRQLLLDALMAAQERLLITYTGNDERTNLPRPPAVPVGELLDVAQATVSGPNGGDVRERIVVRHPLQPFDPANFRPGALKPGSWSFDPVTLRGAQALVGARQPPRPFLGAPLAERDEPVVELDDLAAFFVHPVRAFLRQRLGISVRAGADEVRDSLAVQLDALERWGVGQRLLEARLAGIDGRDAIKAEIARGLLPPGVLGKPVVEDAYRTAEAIVIDAQRVAGGAPVGDPVDVRVELAPGRRLSGTIAGVRGDLLLATTYSRVAPRHRLGAWVRLLALTAARPERPFAAATVGRAAGVDDVRLVHVPPLADDPAQRRQVAVEQLAALADLRDRGLREPLPLFCKTSEAWAAAAATGRDPAAEADREWTTTRADRPREDSELEHRLALGGVIDLARLLEVRAAPDEVGPGWAADEPSRLGRLARRLWDPLLAREQRSAR